MMFPAALAAAMLGTASLHLLARFSLFLLKMTACKMNSPTPMEVLFLATKWEICEKHAHLLALNRLRFKFARHLTMCTFLGQERKPHGGVKGEGTVR